MPGRGVEARDILFGYVIDERICLYCFGEGVLARNEVTGEDSVRMYA